MTYATKQDLIDRYTEGELVRLTDTVNTPKSTIDDTAVDRAIADAESLINGYLRSRMETPVSPARRDLTTATCKLARYYLYKDLATERVRDDYEDVIAWLKDIASGKVSLGDDTSAIEAPSSGSPQISGPCRVFTDDTLKGF